MKYLFLSIALAFFGSYIALARDVNSELSSAYAAKASDVQVASSGVVVKILPDDDTGSRHQRFILKLSNSQTVLIAHNIDLAPKIKSLRTEDFVEFYGEYEWNVKGGVVHWTHQDPAGRHENGWLKHNGVTYE